MTPPFLLTWKGRRVRSVGDTPEGVALKVPEAPRSGSLFFVPSPLEGWGVETLVDRLPPDAVVVVFEKDSELRDHCRPAWNAWMGPRAGDPRLFWLEADTEASVQELFAKLPLGRLRRCEWLTLGGAWLAHSARYRQVFDRLEGGLNRWWANRVTCLHMGPLWTKNLLDNLGTLGPNIDPWPHWGDQTVLVCGAGVTLEGALEWARSHREKLKLVVADTALPVLGAAGLVPDAVVCVEAQHANLRDFAGWRSKGVPLFTDLTSHPPGTRVLGGPVHWFVSEFAPLDLWRRWPWDIPRLPPLGSVGVAATWVSWRLTRGPVVLAGLDFSYPPGKTHARGAPALGALLARTDRLHGMEQPGTWSRKAVHLTPRGWLTSSVMEGYAEVLSDQARAEGARTWVWDPQGLDLGLKRWSGAPGRPSQVQATGVTRANLVPSPGEWLSQETLAWGELIQLIDRYLDGEEALAPRLEAECRRVDYLTFSFPDPDFRPAADWLVRVRTQLRWALSRTSSPGASLRGVGPDRFSG